jgi:hypothetical protein
MGTKAPCIPRAFAISPLQIEVLSWVMLVLQTPESSLTPDKKMPIKSMTESGGGMGRDSNNPYLILDLSDGDQELLLRSFLSLYWQASCGGQKEDLLATNNSQWSQALRGILRAICLWRFGNVTGAAPAAPHGQQHHPFKPPCPIQGVGQRQLSSQERKSHQPKTAADNV